MEITKFQRKIEQETRVWAGKELRAHTAMGIGTTKERGWVKELVGPVEK